MTLPLISDELVALLKPQRADQAAWPLVRTTGFEGGEFGTLAFNVPGKSQGSPHPLHK
jgi:hypothetical protein